MAILRLDANSLDLKIEVGLLESYKPDSEIEDLYEDVQNLKKKLEKNAKRIIGKQEGGIEGYDKELQKDEIKRGKWKKYVSDTYLPELKLIIDRVNDKNKKICPNFEEIFTA